MKKYIKFYLVTLIGVIFFSSCESFDLDLNQDPNNLIPSQTDPTLLLNSIQVDFATFFNDSGGVTYGINQAAMENVRMANLFGTYLGRFSNGGASRMNNSWRDAYLNLTDIQLLKQFANERDLNYHAGIAKFIEAYTLVLLVDAFGEVPYNEAFEGSEKLLNPKVDLGADLYQTAFDLLDSATEDFQAGEPMILPNDYYFNNNIVNWINAINSLKIRMYVTTRLVNAAESTQQINSIIASNNFIQNNSDDFQFNYSAISANPDSRSPRFISNYLSAGANEAYMSNYYMFLLKDSKANPDPRLRYYIYRQTSSAPSGDNLPCTNNDSYDFCYIGDGYWGRDHADDDGVPNDSFSRSTWGVYPIGGAIDVGQFTPVDELTANDTKQGAGIVPFLLSSFTDFYLAESALVLGTSGSDVSYLTSGIKKSFDKVISFGNELASATTGASVLPTQEDIDNYITEVIDEYNTANDDEKLNIIIREFYLASFGNGMDPYNNYRRTGYPSNIQSPVTDAGIFPRTYLYPSDFVNFNANGFQHLASTQVFWDNNPTNFID